MNQGQLNRKIVSDDAGPSKAKRVKQKVETEIERPPVKLLDCRDGKPVTIRFQNKETKKKTEEYNKIKMYRQDQRTKHVYSLQREAWRMKVKSN